MAGLALPTARFPHAGFLFIAGLSAFVEMIYIGEVSELAEGARLESV